MSLGASLLMDQWLYQANAHSKPLTLEENIKLSNALFGVADYMRRGFTASKSTHDLDLRSSEHYRALLGLYQSFHNKGILTLAKDETIPLRVENDVLKFFETEARRAATDNMPKGWAARRAARQAAKDEIANERAANGAAMQATQSGTVKETVAGNWAARTEQSMAEKSGIEEVSLRGA